MATAERENISSARGFSRFPSVALRSVPRRLPSVPAAELCPSWSPGKPRVSPQARSPSVDPSLTSVSGRTWNSPSLPKYPRPVAPSVASPGALWHYCHFDASLVSDI